jgi:hypothetical protein
MSKGVAKAMVLLAGVLLAAGLPEGRPAMRSVNVVEREGRTVVVEEEGRHRVIRLGVDRVPEDEAGLAGAAEGAVLLGGRPDPACQREARLRVQALQQRLLARARLRARIELRVGSD